MRPKLGWFVLLLCGLSWYAGPGISLCNAQTFGPWSDPINVASINSQYNDTYPILSKDGLTMYFTSNRPGGCGGDDLWVAKRESPSDSWLTPKNMSITSPPCLPTDINTVAADSLPMLSSDEHVMFFYSSRSAGSCGAGDIWMTRRHDTRTEDWEQPTNLGCVLNTWATEIAPAFFENPETGAVTLYYGSNRQDPFLVDFDVYASAVGEDGDFGAGQRVADLSSSGRDTRIFIRKDGLEVFITSDRPGSLGLDIWTSTRATLADPWPTPARLDSPVNSEYDDGAPWLSRDGTTLYFFSTRVVDGVSHGGRDIWYTTRAKIGE